MKIGTINLKNLKNKNFIDGSYDFLSVINGNQTEPLPTYKNSFQVTNHQVYTNLAIISKKIVDEDDYSLIKITVTFENKVISLASIYLKSAEEDTRFDCLDLYLDQLDLNMPNYLLGEFNVDSESCEHFELTFADFDDLVKNFCLNQNKATFTTSEIRSNWILAHNNIFKVQEADNILAKCGVYAKLEIDQ